MSSRFTPEAFWSTFQQVFQQPEYCNWAIYAGDKTWTPFAVDIARNACGKLGLYADPEWLRLDVVGFETPARGSRNWTTRIAIEHENKDDWDHELCKLTDIVADLRVLIAYTDKRPDALSQELQAKVDRIEDRLYRVPDSRWLFIFGPRCTIADQPFVAWTLEGNRLKALPPSSIVPQRWQRCAS